MSGPLLVVDAATYRGTVAVVADATVLAQATAAMRGEREERLMPAVASTLADCRLTPGDLGGVVCGAGPGSFTSLRIAASIGKALALAAGLPLFSISSLLLIVAGQPDRAAPGRYLAVLDAMRDEVFAARVNVGADGAVALEGGIALLDSSAATEIAAGERRTMVGPRCDLAWAPHARGVARLGDTSATLQPVDLTAWEPTYGRLAEAQVQWERKHGRSLTA